MDKKKYSADFFISVVTLLAQQNSFVYWFYNTAEMAELVDAPDSKSGEGYSS